MATTSAHTYPVTVAHPMRETADGTPVDHRVTMPGARLTAAEIAAAVASGAQVDCDRCGDAWRWCPDLRDPVERVLPAAEARLDRARAAAGRRPLNRGGDDGLRHPDGLVTIA